MMWLTSCFYAVYLGGALQIFCDIGITDYQFFAVLIPVTILVAIFNEKHKS